MPDPIETEIKLLASPQILEQLRSHPLLAGPEQHASLASTYFDTPDGSLSHGGASLRIRVAGERREQTLKLAARAGPSVSRSEWTARLTDGDGPDPEGLPLRARKALAALQGQAALAPIASVHTERTARCLQFGDSKIEAAFDVASIAAGGTSQTVCELELELIDGRLADLFALARALPLGPQLRWSVESKADRCRALAEHREPVPAPPHPVRLSNRNTRTFALQAIAWNCLNQLLANYPRAMTLGCRDAVHQSRVAIRRLRVAAKVFASELDDTGKLLLAEFKAVADALGPARDLAVILQQIEAVPAPRDQVLEELAELLSKRHADAIAAAHALLASAPFQRLLFEFASWIERGPWTVHGHDGGKDHGLARFAAQVLARLHKKVARPRRPLAELKPEALHHLRIRGKQLRYAASFFAPLFRARHAASNARRYAKALARLQDKLGEINDRAVFAARCHALFSECDPITAIRLEARLNRLLGGSEAARKRQLKAAARAQVELRESAGWWKVT